MESSRVRPEVSIRPIRPDDAVGLCELFAGLSDDDAHRRFFTASRPPPEFVSRMAAVNESPGRGFGLVAVADDGRIVGEAGYTVLADGDGELGITVAADCRGGLGWVLLRMLKVAARRRGVRNLQAEILTSNQPMLSLVRRAAYAVMSRADWTTVRVVFGTGTETPVWPGRTGPGGGWRVLVESASGYWPGAEDAKASGVEVLICPGPGADESRCPALRGTVCPLAAEADLVINALPHDGLAAAHAALHPGAVVCAGPSPTARDALDRLTAH